MSRLIWFGLGAALAVVVIVKGRQMLAQATPEGILDRAAKRGTELIGRAQGFAAEFDRARREAEAELRREAGLPVTGSAD
jgi:hypothetical protein